MKSTTNVFLEGLVSDMHPLTTSQKCMTDALNATLLTFNGNEQMLQNDMGNTLIQDSATGNIMGLNPGFIPLGLKEHGGVMYIASINNKGEGELGTIPSPIIRDIYKDAITLNIDSPIPVSISDDGNALQISNKIYPSDKILINLRMKGEMKHFIGESNWLSNPMSDTINGNPDFDPADLVLKRITGCLKGLPSITGTSTPVMCKDIPTTEVYNIYSPVISYSSDVLPADVILRLGFPDTTSFYLSATGTNTLYNTGIYKLNMFVKNQNGTIKVTNPSLYELQTFGAGDKSNHWFLHDSIPNSVFPKDLLSATLCGNLKQFPSNYKPGYLAIALIPEEVGKLDMVKRLIEPVDVPFTYKYKESGSAVHYYTYFPGFYYSTTSGIYIDQLEAKVVDEDTLEQVPLIPLKGDGSKGAECLSYLINFKSHTAPTLQKKAGSTMQAANFYTTDQIFSNDLWLYAEDPTYGYPQVQTRSLAQNNTFLLTNQVSVDDVQTSFESSDYSSPKPRSGLFCASLGDNYNRWLRLEVDYFDQYELKRGTYTKRCNPYLNDVFGTNLGITAVKYIDAIQLGRGTSVTEKQIGYYKIPGSFDFDGQATIGTWYTGDGFSAAIAQCKADIQSTVNYGGLYSNKTTNFIIANPPTYKHCDLYGMDNSPLKPAGLASAMASDVPLGSDGHYWFGNRTLGQIKVKVDALSIKHSSTTFSCPSGVAYDDTTEFVYIHDGNVKNFSIVSTGASQHGISKLTFNGTTYNLSTGVALNRISKAGSATLTYDPGYASTISIPSDLSGVQVTINDLSDRYTLHSSLKAKSVMSAYTVFSGDTTAARYVSKLTTASAHLKVKYVPNSTSIGVHTVQDPIDVVYKVVPYIELLGTNEDEEMVQVSRVKTPGNDLVFECNFEKNKDEYVNYWVDGDFEEPELRHTTLNSSTQIDGVYTKQNDVETGFMLSPGIYVFNAQRSPLSSIWCLSGSTPTFEWQISINSTEYTCRQCPSQYNDPKSSNILRSPSKLDIQFATCPENSGATSYSNYYMYEPFVIIVPTQSQVKFKSVGNNSTHKFVRQDIGVYKLRDISKSEVSNLIKDLSITDLVMRHSYYMGLLHNYAKVNYLDKNKGVNYYNMLNKFGVHFAEIYSFTDGVIRNGVVEQVNIGGVKYGCTPYIPKEPYYSPRSLEVKTDGSIEYHFNVYVMPYEVIANPATSKSFTFSNSFPNPDNYGYYVSSNTLRMPI